MRVVRNQEEFAEAFQRATSEAKSAFGDGSCFIERYLNKVSSLGLYQTKLTDAVWQFDSLVTSKYNCSVILMAMLSISLKEIVPFKDVIRRLSNKHRHLH